MKEGQDAIYFLTGSSREMVERSPHLEAFRDKGYEVLYLIDPVDEVWVERVAPFEEKKFQSVGKGEVELGSEEEKKKAEDERKGKGKELQGSDGLPEVPSGRGHQGSAPLQPANFIGSLPGGRCARHEPAARTDDAPHGSGRPQVQTDSGTQSFTSIAAQAATIFERDAAGPELKDYARLLHGQALLAEGSPLADPAGFSKLVADLMAKAIGSLTTTGIQFSGVGSAPRLVARTHWRASLQTHSCFCSNDVISVMSPHISTCQIVVDSIPPPGFPEAMV
jgi:molecular chaperone HtpG